LLRPFRVVGPTAALVIVLVAGVTAAAAEAPAEVPTIEVRGRSIPLDGSPLPADLTPADQQEVFEAADASRRRLPAGEGPDWMPLEGVVELWCTRSNPGYGGCSGHHDRPAMDIGVPAGTAVFAAGPGLVVVAKSGGGGRGTYVDLLHPDGSSSHYYHLSAAEVDPGQVVDRGDRIGRSGSTGSSTAPHLHYEEHGPDGQNRPIGTMLGQVGDRVVTYPQGLYGLEWSSVAYGTMLSNDGYRPPVDGDLNGDGRPDRATGAVVGPARSLGVSAPLSQQ
jgi:murein DD-endopeptidase MepM/ murein hydrolase activator NlpD